MFSLMWEDLSEFLEVPIILTNGFKIVYTMINIKEEGMADYTFDGKYLRKSTGQKIGEIDRNNIRAWNGARLGEIDRKNIRDAQGKKVLEFDGKTVKDDLGKKIITIQEIQNIIVGDAGIYLVAVWYFMVKNKQLNFT
jgi:hypothetical protein